MQSNNTTQSAIAGPFQNNLLAVSPSDRVIEDMNARISRLNSFEYLRITPKTKIPAPVPIIKINNEIISTEGNITTFSGASKSGKSALTNMILSAAISTNGMIKDPFDSFFVEPNRNRKAVIHFDTEQARHKHQSNLIAILNRAGMDECPDYYRSYNIRQLDLNKYQEITNGICDAASEAFGGIHLIAIDGIADYIKDVNDGEQSNAIIKFFEDLAIRHNAPLIGIVHTNPGSDKERGHLGSQLQRKSESVLSVKQDGDMSYIEPKLLRMAGKGDIPMIRFTYCKERGYHISCGTHTAGETDKDKKTFYLLQEAAKNVFSIPNSYQYKDAIEAIMKYTLKKITSAKTMFAEMKLHEMICQGEDGNWRLNIN